MSRSERPLAASPPRLRRLASRLATLSLRDALVVGLPLLLIVFAGFWVAAQFIRPAPPAELRLASGDAGSAQAIFAARYGDVLARHGIRLIEQRTAGAAENLRLLEVGHVDAAFFQIGAASSTHGELLTLGQLFREPLWLFYRRAAFRQAPRDVSDLAGRPVAIGEAGSGTQALAKQLIGLNGAAARPGRWLEIGGLDLAPAFAEGRIDAAFVAAPPQSAAVWSLLYLPGIEPVSLARADAYVRRLPWLEKMILPAGSVDLERNIPARDLTLLASQGHLLVHAELHGALQNLLLQAADEVHAAGDLFSRPGELPRAIGGEFPLAAEAARYHKSGKPLLQRYMPFWAATLIERSVVMLVPLVALLIPLARIAPPLYRWRVSARIYRRYGELKWLEDELMADPGRLSRAEWLARLAAIEEDVGHLQTPLAFTDMLYTLREHIALVRRNVLHLTRDAHPPADVRLDM